MQSTRTITRRRSGVVLTLAGGLVAVVAGLLAPAATAADSGTAAEATAHARETAQQLTGLNEHLLQAEQIVQKQQATAAAAAQHAAAARAAMRIYEPELRAIAQSGFAGKSKSRMAAFLSAGSAGQLVQQMATLDAIAARTNAVITAAAEAKAEAQRAQATADQAAATARADRDQLAAQKAEVQKRVDSYQADFARLSAVDQTAVTTAVSGRTLPAPRKLVPAGPAAAIAIRTALAQVGDPYRIGGTGPDAFDCSGLTGYAYAAAGITLPRTASEQSTSGPRVPRPDLQPGDLVFYFNPISHVALYIGDGLIVHATTPGSDVAVTGVDLDGYRFAVRPLASGRSSD